MFPHHNNDDPMTKCRLELETWLQPQISHWIQHGLPILDWVSNLQNGILQIQFLSEHLKWSKNETTKKLRLPKLNWYCGTKTYTETAEVHMASKSHLFYLRCNQTSLQQHSDNKLEEDSTTIIKVWTDEFPFVEYQLQPLMDCDATEQKYGQPPNRPIHLAMCSVLYGSSSSIIPKFAEYYAYHKRLGVQHFWVFVNTNNITTTAGNPITLPPVDDVTYIPYNFRWKDFPQQDTIDNIYKAPYEGASAWQEAMQNQCLSRIRRYGVEWALTIDVDEFVDIRSASTSSSTEEYPLRSFLTQYHNNSNSDNLDKIKEAKKADTQEKLIGALRLRSVPFPMNRQFNRQELRPYRMAMDHVHRWNDKLGTFVDAKRPKMIYRLQFCDTAGVHWCRRYNHGAISKSLNSTHEIMLHHIRKSRINDEYWLGGKMGGRGVLKDSRMAEQYRAQVCHDMIRGPFAAFVTTYLDEEKCNDWPPNSSNKILLH